MKKARNRILTKVVKALDFPSDIYSGTFRIEMYSECEAAVFGVRGISDYSCDRVELIYNKGKIYFDGCGLSCESYVDGVVCVRGQIMQISLSRG